MKGKLENNYSFSPLASFLRKLIITSLLCSINHVWKIHNTSASIDCKPLKSTSIFSLQQFSFQFIVTLFHRFFLFDEYSHYMYIRRIMLCILLSTWSMLGISWMTFIIHICFKIISYFPTPDKYKRKVNITSSYISAKIHFQWTLTFLPCHYLDLIIVRR